MADSAAEEWGSRRFRQKLNERLEKFRKKTRETWNSPPASNPASVSQNATFTASSMLFADNQASDDDLSEKSTNSTGDEEQKLTLDRLTRDGGDDGIIGSVLDSPDLWSAAYREAVENLGEELDIAILERKNVAQLFRELEEIGEEATHESAFLRGVKCLRSLQAPLERFKLALDLASPLTNLEPTVTTAFGVIKSVTVIAISLATADLNFAKQIREMLERISYIDDCDTLGQKTDKKDIHKILVLVYQKLLEFYKTAFEILTRKGAKLIMKMVLENERLPSIVEEFLSHSDTLRIHVEKATAEIVGDIRAMLYDHEISRWLGGDRLSRQGQYHDSLKLLRADQACQFLLENNEFTDWYEALDSRLLVILGDMGSGKTVAASFIVDQLSQRKQSQLPQPKICYYYCRDDETGKTISIVSGLMLSLLEQLPGLKKPFFEWYKEAQASGIFDPAKNTEKLEEFLQKVLEEIDRPVFVVIDGLDECDRASRRRLLWLLKTLTKKVSGLKIMLSSRPQEEILEQLDGTARIELIADPQRDRIIIDSKVERQLFYLSTDVKALVVERLSPLAQGSGIWTKMVIGLIEVRDIRAFDPMRCFLEEIPLPRQLSEIYRDTLLSHCVSNDTENLELASTALKLLAITHRPFSILELAWAVTLGTARHATTVEALAKLVDHQRVMSLIHPFIARVDFSDVKKRQVRLMHQSVKEFVIKEWFTEQPCLQQGPSLTVTDPLICGQSVKSLEAFILDICIRYLLLDEIGSKDLFSEEQVAIAELPQDVDLFSDNEETPEYDPYCTWETWEEDMIRFDPTDRGLGEFFIYASCHWMEFFGTVAIEPLPSLESIEKLCQAGSTRLRNWTQQNCRPDCAIPPRFEFDSSLFDPLSITSIYGPEAMLHNMLENSDFDKDTFLREPAMEAADQILQWGDVSRLKILFFDDKIGHQLQNLDFFRLLIKRWYHPTINRDNWDLAFDLVHHVLDELVQEQWGNELLCVAAAAGCMPIIMRLMTSAQHKTELRGELLRESRIERRSPFGKPMHQSIGEAVWGNHVEVVDYLMREHDIDAHLLYRNSRGENVLHLASRFCSPGMFRRLSFCFPEGVHQEDNQGDTPLMRIITESPSPSRGELVQIMLENSSADLTGDSWDEHRNPLRAAVQRGDLNSCVALINIGRMNPLSALTYDGEGQLDLKDRTPENEGNRLRILKLLAHKSAASTSAQ